MDFKDAIMFVGQWSNENQGIVSIAIFIITIALGLFSGIFSALRRKPKFKITTIPGPTFCCTFPAGKKHGDFDVHRTGVALYLNIANIGSAPSSIEKISIGYHWHLKPFSILWFKFTLGWYWLTDPSTILADFQVMIGENIKVFPFLIQKNYLTSFKVDTLLEVGRATTGVVYFEQGDCWGGCFPRIHNGLVRIQVRVRDVFGKNHCAKFNIPSVSLEEARKYNPSFGKTLAELRGETLPFDAAKQA